MTEGRKTLDGADVAIGWRRSRWRPTPGPWSGGVCAGSPRYYRYPWCDQRQRGVLPGVFGARKLLPHFGSTKNTIPGQDHCRACWNRRCGCELAGIDGDVGRYNTTPWDVLWGCGRVDRPSRIDPGRRALGGAGVGAAIVIDDNPRRPESPSQ